MSIVQAKLANQGEIFAENLKSIRQECGLSQSNLASELGISRNYVSMLEQGRKQPSEQLRKAFAAFADSSLKRKKLLDEIVEHDGASDRQSVRQESPLSPEMLHRSRRPPEIAPPAGATSAAVARFSVTELEQVMETSLARLREEKHPLMKLAHLLTLRTCAEDLERRLSDNDP